MESFLGVILHGIDWGAVAGIFAFILSSGLALREFHRSCVRLKVDCATVYVYLLGNDPDMFFCYAPHILSNKSSLPVSISSAALVDNAGAIHRTPQDSSVILGYNLPEGIAAALFKGFPVNIQPYESVRIDLYFRIHKSHHPHTGLPEARSFDLSLVDQQEKFDHLEETVNLRVRYYTSRKPVEVSVSASIGVPEEKLADLKKRAKVSPFFENAKTSIS